jgi:hypothetical protein
MTDDKEARIWRRLQEVLRYSDEEMETFKANPKFVKMMNTPAFRTHKIVAEVVSSRGCLCQHLAGQRIVLSGNGALLRDECPPIMCLGIVAQLPPVISAVWERFAAGLDPNGILIDTIGCSDVGVECGGWGRVIAKIRVEGPAQP